MKTFGRCTIYLKSEFGIGMIKIEAKEAEVDVRQWAQWQNGVFCKFRKPRQRRDRELSPQTRHASLVILEGWGHPDPDHGMVEMSRTEDAVTSRSRYGACDPRWQNDFNESLAAYLEQSGAKVLADFRNHEAIPRFGGYN